MSPSDLANRPGDFTGPDWVKAHVSRWRRWLGAFRGLPKVQALEVGSHEGRSARWFLEEVLTHPEAAIHCIDLWDEVPGASGWDGAGMREGVGQETFARFQANLKPWLEAGKASVARGLSRVCLSALPMTPHYDFIYIDGSHHAVDVLEDSVQCWWRLRPGGVLIWDDYLWKGAPGRRCPRGARPRMAIDAFLAVYEGKYDILPGRGWQVAIQRR